jgi:hypothetical protein
MVFRHDRVRAELHDGQARVVADDDARLDGLAPDVERRDLGDVAQVRAGGRVGRVGGHVDSLRRRVVAGATTAPLRFRA